MKASFGDAVFIRTGIPAVVKERNDITGKLILETDGAKIKEDMRHGYINGLSAENREEFNSILDSVKDDNTDPQERAERLQTKLTELEEDPRKLPLTRYLRAEMVHIMNTYNIKPNEYAVHESKLR